MIYVLSKNTFTEFFFALTLFLFIIFCLLASIHCDLLLNDNIALIRIMYNVNTHNMNIWSLNRTEQSSVCVVCVCVSAVYNVQVQKYINSIVCFPMAWKDW